MYYNLKNVVKYRNKIMVKNNKNTGFPLITLETTTCNQEHKHNKLHKTKYVIYFFNYQPEKGWFGVQDLCQVVF